MCVCVSVVDYNKKRQKNLFSLQTKAGLEPVRHWRDGTGGTYNKMSKREGYFRNDKTARSSSPRERFLGSMVKDNSKHELIPLPYHPFS